MYKKAYMQPKLVMIEIELEEIIAGSVMINDDETTSGPARSIDYRRGWNNDLESSAE